ncbi:MAG TPA: hypothetical protein PK747_11005 [Acidobacteriota bacterium]|jgi:hypothetical protein|nr:hypothetical protein [Acidobacteriota bacterium]HNT16430.1 hypothetical protein [Acidobacteriota bacterium]HPA27863.1 hypothetical protein [Acidobacteriota bacterium]HQO20042.1 hypothetical protein [Acidobacteriota bacterium]HQQ47919.1 hypothetical protein [Acidobacteriota bacterium]
MKKVNLLLPLFSALCLVVLSISAEQATIGAEKCARICHKIQYDSWLKTRHAAVSPKVDCESCHGKGSDYARLHIMTDPDAAKAAGLVAKPAKASCTEKCHTTGFKEEMIKAVHEHKK